jgi:hypothetical protein
MLENCEEGYVKAIAKKKKGTTNAKSQYHKKY